MIYCICFQTPKMEMQTIRGMRPTRNKSWNLFWAKRHLLKNICRKPSELLFLYVRIDVLSVSRKAYFIFTISFVSVVRYLFWHVNIHIFIYICTRSERVLCDVHNVRNMYYLNFCRIVKLTTFLGWNLLVWKCQTFCVSACKSIQQNRGIRSYNSFKISRSVRKYRGRKSCTIQVSPEL